MGLLLTLAILRGAALGANSTSPVGRWQTVDDVTGKPRAIVRIAENGGVLSGTVEKAFLRPGEKPNPVCDKCTGERYNQPTIGMVILWGMTRDGAEYSGGRILDPDNGKIYRCTLNVSDDGQKLNVRGYIGFSLFGRTQVWHRQE
jgi:uncharacterized protein (DUF2147 family)